MPQRSHIYTLHAQPLHAYFDFARHVRAIEQKVRRISSPSTFEAAFPHFTSRQPAKQEILYEPPSLELVSLRAPMGAR